MKLVAVIVCPTGIAHGAPGDDGAATSRSKGRGPICTALMNGVSYILGGAVAGVIAGIAGTNDAVIGA